METLVKTLAIETMAAICAKPRGDWMIDGKNTDVRRVFGKINATLMLCHLCERYVLKSETWREPGAAVALSMIPRPGITWLTDDRCILS